MGSGTRGRPRPSHIALRPKQAAYRTVGQPGGSARPQSVAGQGEGTAGTTEGRKEGGQLSPGLCGGPGSTLAWNPSDCRPPAGPAGGVQPAPLGCVWLARPPTCPPQPVCQRPEAHGDTQRNLQRLARCQLAGSSAQAACRVLSSQVRSWLPGPPSSQLGHKRRVLAGLGPPGRVPSASQRDVAHGLTASLSATWHFLKTSIAVCGSVALDCLPFHPSLRACLHCFLERGREREMREKRHGVASACTWPRSPPYNLPAAGDTATQRAIPVGAT